MGNIIGSRIELLREEKELTQSELAEILKIQRVSLNYYENGSRLPKIDTLIALSKFFNVTSDYLLGLSDSRQYEHVSINKSLMLSDESVEKIRYLGQKKGFIVDTIISSKCFNSFVSCIDNYAKLRTKIAYITNEPEKYIKKIENFCDEPQNREDIEKYLKPIISVAKRNIALYDIVLRKTIEENALYIADDLRSVYEEGYAEVTKKSYFGLIDSFIDFNMLQKEITEIDADPLTTTAQTAIEFIDVFQSLSSKSTASDKAGEPNGNDKKEE